VLAVPLARRVEEARPPDVGVDVEIRRCVVCAGSTDDLVCASCRARIRGEALERKLREERGGR
jgi:hypothetical protein